MFRSPEDKLGQLVLNRYRLVRPLAQGGMGVVYVARIEGAAGFQRPVAAETLDRVLNLKAPPVSNVRRASTGHIPLPGSAPDSVADPPSGGRRTSSIRPRHEPHACVFRACPRRGYDEASSLDVEVDSTGRIQRTSLRPQALAASALGHCLKSVARSVRLRARVQDEWVHLPLVVPGTGLKEWSGTNSVLPWSVHAERRRDDDGAGECGDEEPIPRRCPCRPTRHERRYQAMYAEAHRRAKARRTQTAHKTEPTAHRTCSPERRARSPEAAPTTGLSSNGKSS